MSARTIGRAVAERLARDAAKVALVDVDAAVEVAARDLGHGADVIALRADVNSATDVDRCFHERYIGSSSKISTAHFPSLFKRIGRPPVSTFAAARSSASTIE
jgi:hypothetical protein